MDTPKSSPEQVQDKIGNATTGTDGTNEQQQLNVKAGAFLKLIPEVSAGFDPSTSAKPTDTVIQLRIQRPNTSRDELDAEALELMEILRDCICKTSELTGYLAGHPDVIAPYQNDISMLDATSSYLTTILGPSSMSNNVRMTADQALRRTEIRSRHYRAIKQMRRIPTELNEGGVSGQGGSGPVLKGRAARLAVNESHNSPKINPFVRSFSGVLRFQLDGAGQEGSGSTEENQDEREFDGSDQGGSRPCQGNRMEEID